MSGKYGDFEPDEVDIYSQPAAHGSDNSRRHVQALKEIIAQKNEPVPRASFAPSMELQPRFAR